MEESSSLEELAGLPAQTTVAEAAEVKQESPKNMPPSSPLPAEGLPDGWTMDQWKLWC